MGMSKREISHWLQRAVSFLLKREERHSKEIDRLKTKESPQYGDGCVVATGGGARAIGTLALSQTKDAVSYSSRDSTTIALAVVEDGDQYRAVTVLTGGHSISSIRLSKEETLSLYNQSIKDLGW